MNLSVPLPGGKSVGLSGGLYNRMQASFTKFMQIPGLPKLTNDDVWVDRKAPNTLVLHTRAGNCIGDMASYDYFTLGGPYSVRGYSPGELGACRRFVEAAAEVRMPLKNYGLPGRTCRHENCSGLAALHRSLAWFQLQLQQHLRRHSNVMPNRNFNAICKRLW